MFSVVLIPDRFRRRSYVTYTATGQDVGWVLCICQNGHNGRSHARYYRYIQKESINQYILVPDLLQVLPEGDVVGTQIPFRTLKSFGFYSLQENQRYKKINSVLNYDFGIFEIGCILVQTL